MVKAAGMHNKKDYNIIQSHYPYIYANHLLYTLLMRLLYGRFFKSRYQAICDLIPHGANVVDVCSGDCLLYQKFLRKKKVNYLGLDSSPHFVNCARKLGVNSILFDVWGKKFPPADYLIMQASLYQFIPYEQMIIEKLLDSSKKKVLVAEPIRNLSDSRFILISKLSHRLTKQKSKGDVHTSNRFNHKKLMRVFRSFTEFESCFPIPGGREMIGIFKGRLGK